MTLALEQLALRPAHRDDAPWLTAMRAHPTSAEYLAVSDQSEADLRAELDAHSEHTGRLVAICGAHQLGALKWTLVNRRSRIAELAEVVVDPAERGQGIGAAVVRAASRLLVEQHGVHRLQLEVYGDNRPAQRAFIRAGFRHEGTRRQAYWRRGAWQDGVLYGLLAHELD
jgi:aminoglycoside 6'-N-acetyltransferase